MAFDAEDRMIISLIVNILFVSWFIFVLIKGFNREKKKIILEAEAKGWKNVKVKFKGYRSLVTYQDENGDQHSTHCNIYHHNILWEDEVDFLYLDQKTYKAKTKTWKTIIMVCGLCFSVIFAGYLYEELSWKTFRHSFVTNGYAVRVDHKRFAIGIDSIIRGEEAYKMIKALYPNQEPPKENREYAIIKLKIKNLSKAEPQKISLTRIYNDSFDDFFDLAENTLPSTSLNIKEQGKGETIICSFQGEVRKKDPIRNLTLQINQGSSFSFPSLPLSKNPLDSDIYWLAMLWVFGPIIIESNLFDRWILLLKSKKTKPYIVLPLLFLLIPISTNLTSYSMDLTQAFFFHVIMIALFTYTWWNIVLLASTKPEPATT
jgi:hypothetical protein